MSVSHACLYIHVFHLSWSQNPVLLYFILYHAYNNQPRSQQSIQYGAFSYIHTTNKTDEDFLLPKLSSSFKPAVNLTFTRD